LAQIAKNRDHNIGPQIIVFAVTALFSVFAYIWLLVVLKWISPDEVEVWEAVMTFVFFPILVKKNFLPSVDQLLNRFCQYFFKQSINFSRVNRFFANMFRHI
jgi:solute carrier family 8 (sodium/calcium exchanger)